MLLVSGSGEECIVQGVKNRPGLWLLRRQREKGEDWIQGTVESSEK
jgi:hypothetical protein